MTWGVLLVLPVRLITFPAKATLIALASFRNEPIVCLVRLETTREIHPFYLLALEGTEKSLLSYAIHESWDDPIEGEGAASSPPAGFVEFDWIALEWSRRLLPRPVVGPCLRDWSIVANVRHGPTRGWLRDGVAFRVARCTVSCP